MQMNRLTSADSAAPAAVADQHAPLPKTPASFLPARYNFILFFSLPFYPVCKLYRRTISYHGHLSLGLGSTVYQVHDPEKLRSSFLVSRMPITAWLYEDGDWYDQDPSSPYFRHVHLYEKAEVKRTVIFYAALKDFPTEKEQFYADHFEGLEHTFQTGGYRFSRLDNNCSSVINDIFYREKWFRKGLLDFIPAFSFKRLVTAWRVKGLEFITGSINEYHAYQFKPQKLCLGMYTLAPDRELLRWLQRNGKNNFHKLLARSIPHATPDTQTGSVNGI
jgi:hypothetical protein